MHGHPVQVTMNTLAQAQVLRVRRRRVDGLRAALRRTLLGIACGLAAGAVHAEGLTPSTVFGQVGGGPHTTAASAGATWDWQFERPVRSGLLTGYWDFGLGRWQSRVNADDRTRAWVSQVGITPVLRYAPVAGSPWYLEAGIGVNLITPLYRSGDKRFSTTFNFGDHIALGMRFGPCRAHELAIRVQHFSNGGVREPNPGENFLQLRYSRHLDRGSCEE